MQDYLNAMLIEKSAPRSLWWAIQYVYIQLTHVYRIYHCYALDQIHYHPQLGIVVWEPAPKRKGLVPRLEVGVGHNNA